MTAIGVLLPIFAVLAVGDAFVLQKSPGDCKLDVSKSFSSVPPLLIDAKSGHFVRASSRNGTILFKRGEEVFLSCSGRRNSFASKGIYKQEVVASCVHGSNFEINGKHHEMKELKCRKWPFADEVKVGKCLTNHTLAHIGFNISTGFISLIELCHNTKIQRTFYTKYLITKEAAAGQKYVTRPKWSTGGLLGKFNVDKLYNRRSQIATVSALLGSKNLGPKYIGENDDYFLARGHMAAKADFFYGTQQMATFYYSNAAPQWQTSNSNNWNAIEMDVRHFARNLNEDLTVYTGTYGVDTLPDINGNMVPLSLDVKGNFPVPRMYWKLVHSPIRQQGIVFIGFTSPYLNSTEIKNEILCEDICDQVNWLTWNQFNIKKGYSYCCEVNEFLRKVKEAPQIHVKGILK